MLGAGFLVGGAAVWFCFSLVMFRFSRRCTQLEMAVGDIQGRLSSYKGRDMSEKRWAKEKQFDAEMAQVLQNAPAERRKYDNDPLG